MPAERAGADAGSGATRRPQRPRLATLVLIATGVVIALGAWIRVEGWARRSSFWVDELRLVVNVADRTVVELVRGPLRYGYGYLVPPGYLVAERAAFVAFGRDERGLRLLSLVAGVGGLVLTAALARRVLGDERALLPTALVAAGAPLAAYAVDARPYALDFALGAALPLVASRWLERPDRGRGLAFGIAFAAAPVVSFGSVIGGVGVLAGVASCRAVRRDRALRRTAAIVAAVFLVVAAAVSLPRWLAKQADERLRAGLDGYWTAVGGFPEEAQGVATWIGARLAALVRFPFAPLAEALPPAVAVAALALGVAALARARSGDARLLVGPPAAGIAVALAGIYPMGARLTLFYAAPSAVLFGALLLWPGRLAGSGARPAPSRTARAAALGAVAAGALLAAPLVAEAWRRERGFERQPARALIAELATRARPGDRIWVDYSAEPAWRFYAPATGLDPARAVIGACGGEDPAAALPLAAGDPPGTRLWLLFSGSRPPERDWLLDRLAARAVPAESVDLTGGRSRVERLDLYVASDAGAGVGSSSPPPKSALWRCAFFEED